MIGKPKYDYGDIVSSSITDMSGDIIEFVGEIRVVDRYGTFGQNEEVSYDVMVNDWNGTGQKMFVKHIIEPNLTLVKKGDNKRV